MGSIAAPQPLESLTRLARQSSTQSPRKLRDSCTGCANSKLKCSKEKPTCTRCSRRGIRCEYAASKRARGGCHLASKVPAAPAAGSNRPNNNSTKGSQESHESFWSPPSHTPLLTPRSITHPSPGPDIWRKILSPCVSAGGIALSPLLPIDTDFDDLFDSILQNSEIEAPPQKQTNPNARPLLGTCGRLLVCDQDRFPSQNFSAGEVLDFDCILENSNIEAPPQQQTYSNAPSSLGTFGGLLVSEQDRFPSQDLSTGDASGFDVSPCESRRCCLTVALDFLAQLSPNAQTACTLHVNQAGQCKLPTIESVILENKQIVEAISNMLDCPCLQDEYVVVITSLIVFKVMAWYAAAAADKSPTDDGMSWSNDSVAHPQRRSLSSFGEQVLHLPTIVGNYCVDGNDRSRMAAQLVLSELHRVQRLVNLLSKRLEDIRLRSGGWSSSSSCSSSVADCGDVQAVRTRASSLSAPTFYQLEADLRKRLRVVSSETIDILRRE